MFYNFFLYQTKLLSQVKKMIYIIYIYIYCKIDILQYSVLFVCLFCLFFPTSLFVLCVFVGCVFFVPPPLPPYWKLQWLPLIIFSPIKSLWIESRPNFSLIIRRQTMTLQIKYLVCRRCKIVFDAGVMTACL